MASSGPPHTPPNLHTNPPVPRHRAREMPRRNLHQLAVVNATNAAQAANNMPPPQGAMGPPPPPAPPQPREIRTDEIQTMMESTDADIQRQGRVALGKAYVEHLPRVQAASQRLQRALEFHDPNEWPLPTVPEDLDERRSVVEANVGVLLAALDDCKDFGLPMQRNSDKDDFFDEVHQKLHGSNAGIGGSGLSAKASASQTTANSAAVSSATRKQAAATRSAASPTEDQTLVATGDKTNIDTTTSSETSNWTASHSSGFLDSPMVGEGTSSAVKCRSSLQDSPMISEAANSTAGWTLSPQESRTTDETDDATIDLDQPGTPPEARRQAAIHPDYIGTSAEAFTATVRQGHGVTRTFAFRPSEVNSPATAEPDVAQLTARQIANQRRDGYDQNCPGYADHPMHGMASPDFDREAAVARAVEIVSQRAIDDEDQYQEALDTFNKRIANNEDVELGYTHEHGFTVLSPEAAIGSEDQDHESFAQMSPATGASTDNQANEIASAMLLESDRSGFSRGSGVAVSSPESAVYSPLGGVALSAGLTDQDVTVRAPASAVQSNRHTVRGSSPSFLEASPMNREVPGITQALVASPMTQEDSHKNAVFSIDAPLMGDGYTDDDSTTAASMLHDPTINQSEQKNKGKAAFEGRSDTQQQQTKVPANDDSMGLQVSASGKKGRNPAVPDPTHPGLKDTLTERMLNWNRFQAQACLSLTLEDTTILMESPNTIQAILLHHFEVGMNGVEAICKGTFSAPETAEVTAERVRRLEKVGARKRGDGGFSAAVKKAQQDSWYGIGLWGYYGVKFKQTKKEKKLKKGGKWICFGAPYEAFTNEEVQARQRKQALTLGGGKDREGKDIKSFRATVKRERVGISKGGVGILDKWTSSGAWADDDGLFAAVKKAMASSALRITNLYEDYLDPIPRIQAFVPAAVGKSTGKRKEPSKELTPKET